MKHFGKNHYVLVIIITSVLSFLMTAASAVSSPTMSLPSGITVVPGSTIEIPINISGVSGANVGGYLLRLDYDKNVLLNLIFVTDDTLSAEGNPEIISILYLWIGSENIQSNGF